MIKDRPQLIQIPDIELKLAQQERVLIHNLRRYLYIANLLIILGVTLFYTGFSKQLFDETRYQYESPGIILPGEADDIYYSWRNVINTGTSEGRAAMGKRQYRLDKKEKLPRAINAWLQILGVLLLCSGIMGCVLEKRFNKA